MSIKKNIIVGVGILLVVAFIALAISDVMKKRELEKLQRVQINDKSIQLKKIELEQDKVERKLNEAIQDKTTSQQEVDKAKQEAEELRKKTQELEQQLQAKLEAKNKLAQASTAAINTATRTKTASAASHSGGSVQSIVIAAANKYGVSSDLMLKIAMCESTMNPFARNTQPVIVGGVNYGHAEGLFQFIPGTWTRMSTQAGYAGASVTDVHANANVAAWAFSTGHKGEWECK